MTQKLPVARNIFCVNIITIYPTVLIQIFLFISNKLESVVTHFAPRSTAEELSVSNQRVPDSVKSFYGIFFRTSLYSVLHAKIFQSGLGCTVPVSIQHVT